MRLRLLLLLLALAPTAASAAETGTVALVYLDGAGAPPSFQQKVEERLRASLEERGQTVVPDPTLFAAGGPQGAGGGGAEAKLAGAKRDLDRGIAAYRQLSLDASTTALQAAESQALEAVESPQAAAVVYDARLYLGIVALANGKAADAKTWFTRAAQLDPEKRLDTRSFAPDVVKAYEAERHAVATAPGCELALASEPEGATLSVDGRPWSAGMKIPPGQHLVSAASDLGSGGLKLEASGAHASATVRIQPDGQRLVGALRAASKRNDAAALDHAVDAFGGLAGASTVVMWDLRNQAGGRIEAPLRLRDVVTHAWTRSTVAELGNGVVLDAPMKSAVAALYTGGALVASAGGGAAGGDVGDDGMPIVSTTPPGGGSRDHHHGIAPWIWWVGGGVALAAAGGAAALASQAGGSSQQLEVQVKHP